MKYDQVWLFKSTFGNPYAFECEGCGALVKNKELHDAFHAGLDRVADDSTWAAFGGRPLA